jgi:hypothetical protein
MSDIYERHANTFRNIDAAVILDAKTHEFIGRIAFKTARSGLRVTCFLHVLGTPMVSAFATGGGYDRHTAAASVAAYRIKPDKDTREETRELVARVKEALKSDGGYHWDQYLEKAGFVIYHAL